MGSGQVVTVFGAYGHTGRFVVAELLERGFVPVLSGRDAEKLKALAASIPNWTSARRRSTIRPRSTTRWPEPRL